ncbi:hypothetical protein DV532_25695 (plasmid) [Pseudomonas sp. Leaf58]|uniref:toxin co-regulated pilus biosynthesis Q family protein n=1 Tax=Pseudomonas sp. Leaf58 TaxID=1736226 RepID=UPI0006F70463|nr:toxin co-regulated pilus biosynthesis Q family protein [Pseudomonas sp. Leaf58]AYG47692.1 hypothetical protein DV532_25695 [Pseudomonas sp. Leaf58]KQN62747.1 hypothetical protein ASF02_11420 [Pseudomonas sp. Leaf58]
MPRKLKLLTAALIGAACSNAVHAELYISPVVRDSVTYQKPADVPAPAPSFTDLTKAPVPYNPAPAVPVPAPATQKVVGTSTVHGKFEMESTKRTGEMSFGKNVPLFAALENLVPNSKSWSIVFEPGTENTPVSWRDAANWRDALDQISKNNRLVIAVNEQAKRISVSRTADMAQKLAQPGSQVWTLKAGKSLRENLNDWAAKANWQIDWSKTEMNYPIDHTATLVGPFAGKGGVLDRVLSATADRQTPLTGRFYRGNNVVVITEAGYSPEHQPGTPMTDTEAY